MGILTVYNDSDPATPLFHSADAAVIAARLGEAGIRFERWQALRDIPSGADDAAVFDVYKADIDRLFAEEGYRSVDIVRMLPDNERRAEMRGKFLDEHTHAEDEVRFFVEGSGMFYLHLGDQVCMVRCEAGDFIGVPAGTPHWFDMGPAPRFTAIRLFMSPDGWAARFTGRPYSERFPRYETAAG